MNDAFDDLLRAMKRAREALYNGFEPHNQSRAYHDADAAIMKAGLARIAQPEAPAITGPNLATCSYCGEQRVVQRACKRCDYPNCFCVQPLPQNGRS
jgi:hypothetical protein